ncbi:hypothetical protein GDO81_025453 [Engystomops pustulosus]|uniref:Uncharacterized protein n=1 Tax=Engystomops pustulosus TaxID=76066 RepID=A0AAV6ZGL8_ENGPU|nr:hypothetical protein GDO81_025453 [Engystomops pustulosus]
MAFSVMLYLPIASLKFFGEKKNFKKLNVNVTTVILVIAEGLSEVGGLSRHYVSLLHSRLYRRSLKKKFWKVLQN